MGTPSLGCPYSFRTEGVIMLSPEHIKPRRVDGHLSRLSVDSRRLTGQAGQITQAARSLYETKGVAKTTVKDIAAEAGVTRELIYYYFHGKKEITEAVLDDYIEDLVESAMVWNEGREFGKTRQSLRECVQTFRRTLYDAAGNDRPMIRVIEELGVRDAFDVRAVRETVDALNACVASEYARFHTVEIDMVYEMFCVVIFGMVGLLKLNPSITDDELMKVVEQTFHLDMEDTEPPLEGGR